MLWPERFHRSQILNLWFLVAIIVLCCGVEATLQIADWLDLGPRLRATAYENGGFWAGLLRNWQPNYAAQPYTMFLTYGFLHGGLIHLAVNMVTLWSLGREVIARVGNWGCALLYFGAMIGGGAGFAALATGPAPMVGASGALFGLAGGLLAWAYVDRYTLQETLWPVLRAAAMLVTLNLVLWWAMDGQLAWQTHLGGFLIGWVLALLIDPRARTSLDLL
ncbi:rhomboid family intramembrane serine protease [Primorskyibacter flagellatus]|uniref:Membrane associated serine protease, rhomboid family n=1 Tax=Primorskyibacter flagellatus TaxID=1387277 RepID=A0A1W2DZJ3_9RHOB|nr:rhomboid family intramembrane serine protease [Primorskyibacter flagellatus]SMD03005.1 Membrane associated serine protease, rhomboid family [Primorskyibacter flagellatus]